MSSKFNTLMILSFNSFFNASIIILKFRLLYLLNVLLFRVYQPSKKKLCIRYPIYKSRHTKPPLPYPIAINILYKAPSFQPEKYQIQKKYFRFLTDAGCLLRQLQYWVTYRQIPPDLENTFLLTRSIADVYDLYPNCFRCY